MDPKAQEQIALSRMYERLAQMRAEAVTHRDDARFSSDGTPAGRFNRDALQHRYSQQISAFTAAEAKLAFGRLDTDDGESLHIGRMGLTDGTTERRQLLIDWRAPSAAPFYTATAMNPLGVRRRRHIRTKRDRVEAVADEYLQADAQAVARDDLGSAGDSALLEALNAPRTGRMGDIIETIQAEQDRIIRSDRNGVLVVQGGPGTGKTVVALHRAAYLLYTHRERLGGHGVLVIGPNQTFLSYIGQVLPNLGESSVVLATMGTLFPGVNARLPEAGPTAEIKGRLSMSKVIDNAVLHRQILPKRAIAFTYDRGRLRLEPSLLIKARRQAWASRLPHNRARQIFLRVVLDGLAKQVVGRPGVKQMEEYAGGADYAEIRKEMAADPAVHEALAGLWPPLTAPELLSELYSSVRRICFATPGWPQRDRDLLHRTEPDAWTAADVPLLDEAAELLGPVGSVDRAQVQARAEELAFAEKTLDAMNSSQSAEADLGINFTLGMVTAEQLAVMNEEEAAYLSTADRAAADREWTYGHVIVDEAQELSPLAWRMVMRRCPMRSMTLVGDVAQTSDAAGTSSWAKAMNPHVRDRWRLEELTVNYRTPAEIMQVATPVLAAIAPTLTAPISVRTSGFAPWTLRVSETELPRAIAAAAARELQSYSEGQLAILVAPGQQHSVLTAVRALVPHASAMAGLGHRVVVLEVVSAKGLEFDSVLLIEPADIIADLPNGLSDLYVALTRATQRLGILHAQDLPEVLATAT
ncbi:helicase [Nakamurella antarctica]|uniref:Helicase n=2 Tax=Nakamurella antarctica TaxID=1902245 RepID=A0A3G8ZQB3_9ACTN|nr:helicase [Nakamurella antarctica]